MLIFLACAGKSEKLHNKYIICVKHEEEEKNENLVKRPIFFSYEYKFPNFALNKLHTSETVTFRNAALMWLKV